MLQARHLFIFILSMLALFPVSARDASCDNGDGLKPVKTAQLNYPRRAESRGIEGYVTLRFTISAAGDVEDVKIIESQPKGVFDRTSVRTISKYKFTPCMQGGAAIDVPDVEQTFNFSLGQ